VQEIDDLARTADAAASRVFLMSEDPRTRAACGGVLRTLGQIEGVLHELGRDADGQPWDKLNEDMECALRNRQRHLHFLASCVFAGRRADADDLGWSR